MTAKLARIVFYFPMLAVINLFIYILKIPTLETVGSDLALLDLAAGHFAKVHFLTSSQVSFTFAREVVSLANRTVRIATMAAPRGTTNRSTTYSPDLLPINISGEPVSLYLHRLPLFFVRVLIPFPASQASVFASNADFEALNTLSTEFFENLSAAGDMTIF
jgi:hypothetical protein